MAKLTFMRHQTFMPFYYWEKHTLYLNCHVQPGAKHNSLAGLHNERLKIRIMAPPVEGKANKLLISFLAKIFDTPKQRITLIQGSQGRSKKIKIENPGNLPEELSINLPAV